jgi:hypothetical protein
MQYNVLKQGNFSCGRKRKSNQYNVYKRSIFFRPQNDNMAFIESSFALQTILYQIIIIKGNNFISHYNMDNNDQ